MPNAFKDGKNVEERLARYFDNEYLRQVPKRKVSDFLVRGLARIKDSMTAGCAALDVGCGCGSDAIFMARTGIFSSVEGVDLSRVGIDSAKKNAESVSGCDMNFKVGNFINADLRADYSLIFVNNVIEYIPASDKKAFVEKMMASTKPGGINMISFATSLPNNFVDELLDYRQMIADKLPLRLFPNSDKRKATPLQFEQKLLEMYRNSGWSVIMSERHEGERNFVSMQLDTIIVQRPLTEDLKALRS